MPFIFSDDELDELAIKLCARIIPNMLDAMKVKVAAKAKQIPPNLMDVEELMARLHVNKKWIYRKVQDSVIPARKVGKFIMFERAEIELRLAEGRIF